MLAQPLLNRPAPVSCQKNEEVVMIKKGSRSTEEKENMLDKLRFSLGFIAPEGDPTRKKFYFSIWYFILPSS